MAVICGPPHGVDEQYTTAILMRHLLLQLVNLLQLRSQELHCAASAHTERSSSQRACRRSAPAAAAPFPSSEFMNATVSEALVVTLAYCPRSRFSAGATAMPPLLAKAHLFARSVIHTT
jgi:hypothetical protein